MFYVLQNEAVAARKRCPILLTDSATGTTGQSGVALTNIYAYVSINGGAFAGGAGTIAAVNFGQYYYEFDASEINTLGLAGIHVTALGCRDYDAIVQVAAFNMYSTAGAGLTAGDVWSYGGGRSITGGIADTVTNPVDITTASMTGIANTTWDTDVSAYTSPSAGYDLTEAASGGAGISAYDVWNFVLSDSSTAEQDLTGIYSFSSQIDSKTNDIDAHTQAAYMANSIWSDDIGTGANTPYGAGTAGTILYDLSLGGGSGISAADVWSYSDRTITGGAVTSVTDPVSVSTASMSGIANTVWNTDVSAFTSPSAGYDLTQAASGGAGISAADVWNYTMSNSQTADYNVVTTLNNTDSIISSAYPISDIWQWDSSTNTDPSVGFNLYQLGIGATGYAGGGGITAGDVWSYASRTITGGIADTVTSVTDPVLVDPLSMTGIAGTVWSTDISGYVSLSAGFDLTEIASVAGFIDSSISGVPQGVWEYDISAITTAGTAGSQLNLAASPSGAGLTSGDVSDAVWNAATSSYITSGTFGLNTLRSDVAGVAGTVSLWTGGAFSGVYADTYRIDEDYNAAIALKDILTGVGSTITGNITGDLSGSVGSVTSDVTLSVGTQASIANSVWSTDVSSYTSPSAGYDLSNATAGGGITAGDVWTYATRTITGGIADTVTDVTNGVIVTTNNDKTGYSLSSTQTFDLTGNVSGSVGSVTADVNVSTSSMSGIADTVWNYATRTLTSTGAGISAYDVWNFDPTAMTVPQAGAILTDIQTDTNTIITDIGNIPNNVWASDVSGYSTPGEAGYELTQAALGGGGVTAGDVWTYATRTITGGIADTVTTLTDRAGFAITGGTVDTVTNGVTVSTNNDKTGYALSSTQTFDLTGNITGNLSGSVGSVTGNVGGNVVGSVASVTNPVTFNSGQYAAIASSVWNAGTRTLTSGGSGISAYDVWNFVLSDSNTAEVDLVQAASGAGLTAGDVWTYGSRTITGGIADTVTSVTNPVTVGTNNDKTGYALSGAGVSAVQSGLSTLTSAQVGTEVDSSLSDVGLTSTVTGRIDVAVSSRLASSSYVVPPTEAAIAGTVWSYTPRTLTSGAGATAGDVWTYATRTLTSGAGITVNGATNIINGPYFVKSNVDSQDGTLDVIRGMVQDIQLTVTDAFQNPFDVTALGLAVNFYDQAGTLVTSYATTELYGPAGLVQFTLNTAVTANEGRYNLILSAAGAGNTIKFGPLQTLVRPF